MTSKSFYLMSGATNNAASIYSVLRLQNTKRSMRGVADAALEISEKDLDEQWELNWENYADDDCWGSTNLKDSIWNDEYGIRRDMLWHINHMQQLITPSHWEEINSRKEKVNSSFTAFKKLREKFDGEKDAGKYDDYSRGEIRAIKPVWRHSREYEKPARD